jgi:hypothetical protein
MGRPELVGSDETCKEIKSAMTLLSPNVQLFLGGDPLGNLEVKYI